MRLAAVAAAIAVVAALLSITSATAEPDEPTVVNRTWIDTRTVDLEIASPALGHNAMVRLLMPVRWVDQPTREWPVLYLLHGCCDPLDYQSWTHFTDVEQLTANEDVIVVLPSDGRIGMYSNWWNNGGSNKPDWETFHTEEVRSIIERDYRAGTKRAAAGLSIGGYGAMAYAYRKRGMFAAAASYSGSPDTLAPLQPAGIKGILESEGLDPNALWGDEVANNDIWRAHNPANHVADLRGVQLYVSAGDGNPGPLDPPGQEFEAHESMALASSSIFVRQLDLAGVPVTTNFYGAGTHNWTYWERELHASWPMIKRALGL
ncbi:S-formylglutathione hydrolase FrmB [Herbihabitans rhizosphaerae]|uniref:S-formylglutathione hydrolase FrmB n=1 Tax=Herbihabitans rhizosphaerae TaxID=1872711 RepID=A0A4Q7KLV5_9PSEU|nr:alpha/beta hydrolase family protein [Herbihabitans rhizosphaerae]RZS37648.1 S-formylglutathione hydrolase FrmB [Herbihabitans rhizosphaerae]